MADDKSLIDKQKKSYAVPLKAVCQEGDIPHDFANARLIKRSRIRRNHDVQTTGNDHIHAVNEVKSERHQCMSKPLLDREQLTNSDYCDNDPIIQENQIQEKKGDLFSCPASEALAHCISADVKMGKGIAVLFKKKFNGVQDLIKQGKKPGEVAVLRTDTRFIFYLVTKEKYWHKPTYKTVQRSLEDMVKHCQDNNVTHISMPKIGCGLDGLEWPKVRQILNDVTKNTDIEVTVYELAK